MNLIINLEGSAREVAEPLIMDVHEGRISCLELRLLATMLAKISELILADKDVLDNALMEASYRRGESIFGHKFDVRETGTKYDFSKSYAWLYANGLCSVANDKRKEVETVAKTIKTSAEITIDGATLEVLPAIKTSSTSIIFTLNK